MALVTVNNHRPSAAAAEPGPGRLDDPDPDIRRRAVLAGGEDMTAAVLLERLPAEPDLSVRQAIFDVLVREGDAVAVTGLVDLLRSEDAYLRNEAITALQEVSAAAAVHIDGLLASDDPDVRIFTVNILRDLRHARTVDWLCRVLEGDGHANVVGTALDHALEVATPAMRPAVLAALARFPADGYIAFVGGLVLERLERDAT